LRELKLLRRDSVVATLVHDEQFVEEIPMELHDVPVDFIATPSRLIKVEQKYPKPLGLIRDKITIDFLDKMPFLRVFISFSP
ncbi:MAG: 5-formyltetrahydrofolate cyclo-ligase, partial [Thermoproteales archaeon]|nr:5-formyltetrahydrofolate cyclo-ligase [Thermoproteales archaeon]